MSKVLRLSTGVLLLLSFNILPLHAEPSKLDRTLTVQGQGKASAVPDIAVLAIEVSHEGPELDPLLAQVRKDMTKVLDVTKGQGVADKDVQTEFFQVHPKYARDRRGNKSPSGYVVANRVSVKIRELKKTGKVLSAALNAGATTVDGPNFELDNREAAELEALTAATKDAKSKAQTVAQAAGVQLGDVMAINPQSVNWPVYPRRMALKSMSMAGADAAEEPMAAGEQTLTADVSLTYAIR